MGEVRRVESSSQRFADGLQSLSSDARHALQSTVVGGGLQVAQGVDAEDGVDGGGRFPADAGDACQFILGPERRPQLVQQRRASRFAQALESSRDRPADSRQTR